jgi:MYXO-CTERM domain-containing protein
VEWWREVDLGLEHGVTIAERPHGDGSLVLSMRVRGASPRTIGDSIALEHEDAQFAQYAGLTVVDAMGATIPASMRAEGSAIRIEVDDARAVYPLVVDPLVITLEQILPSTTGTFDCPSIAITRDGRRAMCSSNPARIWVRNGSAWTQESTFNTGFYGTASALDGYGQIAALGTGVSVIILFNNDTGPGAWVTNTTFSNVASDTVAISPDGAYVWGGNATTSQIYVGSQFIPYMRVAAYPGGAATAAGFSGDTLSLAVGNAAAGGGAGAVMVYQTQNNFALAATLNGAANERFGQSVAMSGDGTRMLVGAPGASPGVVHAYVLFGGTWYPDGPALTNGAAGDRFGTGVTLSDDGSRAFVSAPVPGCVYVFVHGPSGWGSSQGSVCGPASAFGSSISASAGGTRVAISRNPNNMIGGAVYIVPGPSGAACGDASDCTSGYCFGGICCSSSCGLSPGDPPCQDCRRARTGQPDGTCAALAPSVAPLQTCRASTGACDIAEVCSPTSTQCPPNAFEPPVLCRPSAGLCDVAEFCTGTSAACPPDMVESTTFICRLSQGVCDPPTTCDGTHAMCPAHAFAPSTTVCRPFAGLCDVAEYCDGTTANCPADRLANAGTVCNPMQMGVCDAPDVCNGMTADCPATYATGVVCRPPAGPCDVPEVCLGTSANCPADGVIGSGVVCRMSTASCDPTEHCDGTDAQCPPDVNMCIAMTDTGVPHDAAVVDAGPAADASVNADASAPHPDAATTAPAAAGGCSCRTQRSSNPSPLAWVAFGALLLAAGRRARRSRRGSRASA